MAEKRSCTNLWRESPPKWAGLSHYISGDSAIGNQVNSIEVTNTESCSVKAQPVTQYSFQLVLDHVSNQEHSL